MKTKLTPIAAAAAIALVGAVAAPAFAQSAAAPAAAASAAKADDVQQVVVTGIRGSLQTSINQKRIASSHVEVITAEDIGKLPDKNVADSLAHVPGVTISSAGATEGGFDEADRVSMRGTSPSLTQTFINGHNVGTGDWFILDQSGTVGRSTSYSLLPSEIVGSVVVHKTSEASLVEGGVVGTVDIITRKPLEFSKSLTVNASAGEVYSDLAKKSDPQLSALVNLKNDAGTLGLLVQGFSETRHLRREGVEVLGYDTVAPGSPVATAVPALSGVLYPHLIGNALFEQTRKRIGGDFDLEFKPSTSVTLDLNGFTSHMEASNINRNYMLWLNHPFAVGQVPSSYTVNDGVMTSGSYPATGTLTDPNANVAHGIYDQISRPGEAAESKYLDFDGKFQLTDRLTIKTQMGTSFGYGYTGNQDVAETDISLNSATFKLNGIGSPASFSLPGTTASNIGPIGTDDNSATSADWIFGADNEKVDDKENWAQFDGDYSTEGFGPLVNLKFGARYNDHLRDMWGAIGQGPLGGFNAAGALPATSSGNYPSNSFAVPQNPWEYSAGQLAAYDALYANRNPVSRAYYSQDYGVGEKVAAGYIQGDLEGDKWSGNIGLRFVQTKERVQNYQQYTAPQPGGVNSDWGNFKLVTIDHTYNDLLPSMNLKFDVTKDTIVRLAASRTMTRADYSALGGSIAIGSADDATHTGGGTGGNPDLKPITSNNFDASFEYYFDQGKGLASASLFYMDLTSITGLGTVNKTIAVTDSTNPTPTPFDFTLTVPINSSGSVKGIELAYQQPIYGNFGVEGNYTYTDGTASGHLPLVGCSRNTYNATAYFENDMFNARVSYNRRSAFYSGLDRSTAYYQAATADLTASLGYTINKSFGITLEGRNLNDPHLKYYAADNQPRAYYNNGRQYYLTAHYTY